MKPLLFLFVFLTGALHAQRRYYDPVFAGVDVEHNIVYGINANILSIIPEVQAIPQLLVMDVYTPAGDTATARPLVILLHSGYFFPPWQNGGCAGTIQDADNVEIATRLARMGYVAAVADYRLGWNPIASSQTERVFTFINALWRGVQDSRTCVRFFRKSHFDGNAYGIDPDKITLWGLGTGGYIALASAALDTVTDTYIPKFTIPNGGGPMIQEAVNGNVDGTSLGIVPLNYYNFLPGDTLSYPNHVFFSSEFGLAVNLGGAIGDTSWLDAGDPPVVSFHTPDAVDFIQTPCGTNVMGLLLDINLPTLEVTGSCGFQPLVNTLGNNDVLTAAGLNDALSVHAHNINGDLEGFYPFFGPTGFDSASPWEYAISPEPYGVTGSDCDTNSLSAGRYIDTILAYFAPRACAVFGLYDDCQVLSGAQDSGTWEPGLTVQPNPAAGSFLLQTDPRFVLRRVELADATGRICRVFSNIDASQFRMQRDGLAPGVYFVRVTFREGFAVRKVIFQTW